MKQETNNEIDLLLRRWGRAEDTPASDGDLRVHTDHLDADELSAYAENVLPAPARARYTEHLAECAGCRELVVQLSSAAGVAVTEPTRVSEPSGLMKFLASLFSPMVLRYAIPAVGLAVVAVIGIGLFLRGERAPNDVATVHESQPKSPAQSGSVAYSLESEKKNDSPAATPDARATRPKESEGVSSNDAAPAPAGVAGSVPATPAAKAVEAPQPVVTAEEPPPPAPKPTPADAFSPQAPQARGQETQARTAAPTEERGERDKAANQAKDEDKREVATVSAARAAKKAASPAPAAGAGASTNFQIGDTAKARDDNAEVRTVAGRRFRKQRGVWVDTVYNNAATVSVKRGSEQYRALVADEPEIKTIAEQLDGEIIVVWKGRPYRIQ